MKKVFALATAALVLNLAAPAAAQNAMVNFTVTGNGWFPFGYSNSGSPFGLTAQPTVMGSFNIIGGNISSLNYVTGTRTWTDADITGFNLISSGNNVVQFGITFTETFQYVYSNNTAAISDGQTGIACNDCVSFTTSALTAAVPEPATWAMMLMGFGGMGVALRRRKRSTQLLQMA